MSIKSRCFDSVGCNAWFWYASRDPKGSAERVGGETREWQEGKAWVFDDTIEHEAWNDSSLPRTILIFDIWHPQLTALERDLVRETTVLFAAYNDAESTSQVGAP